MLITQIKLLKATRNEFEEVSSVVFFLKNKLFSFLIKNKKILNNGNFKLGGDRIQAPQSRVRPHGAF